MFQLVENRLSAYADDSQLLAVVRKPADRPAVAASLNRDLARIQEWGNHWCIILNPNKTKALLVCRSRTVNPPHDDLVLSVVPLAASPNLDQVHGIVSRVSQRIGLLRLVNRIFLESLCTSLLFCICSPNP